jgi:D-glycero-alpha-D-manno-heptose-7-phosphate kinase
MAANWIEQQRLDPAMCTPEMAQLYDAMRSAGAVGGKAAGAGAGGSMFFFIPGDVARAERTARDGGVMLLPLRWAGRGVSRD